MQRRAPRHSAVRLILAAAVAAASLAGCDYFTGILDKNDATLSSLTITDNDGAALALSPSYSRTTISYTATVSATATSLTINAVTYYSGAKVGVDQNGLTLKEGSVTASYPLSGDTSSFVIQVVVAAANQSGLVYDPSGSLSTGEPTQQIYTITVTRKSSSS